MNYFIHYISKEKKFQNKSYIKTEYLYYDDDLIPSGTSIAHLGLP